MIPDFVRTLTIILILLSGYLIVKKITELEQRVIIIEKTNILEKNILEKNILEQNILKQCVLEHKKNLDKKDVFEEEYSTDNFINFVKNSNFGNITIMKDNVPDEIQKEKEVLSPEILPENNPLTETVFQFTDTVESEKKDVAKKYNNMKLAELQKISQEYNIDLKINGKNKSKKILIKEILSHLSNNG